MRLARPAPRQLLAPAAPDEVLLQGVAVLRAVGARIVRYEVEAGALEARVQPWSIPGVVRLTAVAEGTGTRVRLDSDAPGAGPLLRLLARELTRGPVDPDEREERA